MIHLISDVKLENERQDQPPSPYPVNQLLMALYTKVLVIKPTVWISRHNTESFPVIACWPRRIGRTT